MTASCPASSTACRQSRSDQVPGNTAIPKRITTLPAKRWGGHERRRAISEPGLPPPARVRGGTAKPFRPRAPRSSCPPHPSRSVLSQRSDRGDSRVLDDGIAQQLLAHLLD